MNIIDKLKKIYSKDDILTSKEELYIFSEDTTFYSSDKKYPLCVVFPENSDQISKTVKIANDTNTPVVVRAAGTNHCGGCIPFNNAIVICITKMNKILSIDENNLTCVVEPGVVLADLQKSVEEKGLFYPPDPSNLAVSTVGGSIALSSGGPRTFKYGTTKDYVLNLEVVLADGTIINTGANTAKNVSGYNLTQLFVGSEGTLGIVTKATLKLIPKPEAKQVLFAYFNSINDAANTVTDIISNKIVPSVIDLLDKFTLQTIEKFHPAGLLTDKEAALLIEIDGLACSIEFQQNKIVEILNKNNCAYINVPKNEEEMEKIWTARRSSFGSTAKLAPNVVTEDIVVPRDKIPELIIEMSKIFEKYNLQACIMGHAGDGNIHPNIPFDGRDKIQVDKIEKIKNELFYLASQLGGTISGEHGIGMAKSKYMKYVVSQDEMKLMKNIKIAFDKKNILNPGKIFED